MKIAEKCKVFVIGALVAALAAGTAVPALAARATGYTPATAVEAQNDVDQAKVQAIRDALNGIDVSYSESGGTWIFDSDYLKSNTDAKKSFIIPWVFTENGNQNVTFALTAVSQNEEAPYYWNKMDILYGEYGKFTNTVSYQVKNVDRVYASDTKTYIESINFIADSGLQAMADILSSETAYIRFNGAKVNGTQRTGTFLIDNDTRQGITDIINLYNLLLSATPEERTAALNS